MLSPVICTFSTAYSSPLNGCRPALVAVGYVMFTIVTSAAAPVRVTTRNGVSTVGLTGWLTREDCDPSRGAVDCRGGFLTGDCVVVLRGIGGAVVIVVALSGSAGLAVGVGVGAKTTAIVINSAIGKAMADIITADRQRCNKPAPRPAAPRISPMNGMTVPSSAAMAIPFTHFGLWGDAVQPGAAPGSGVAMGGVGTNVS